MFAKKKSVSMKALVLLLAVVLLVGCVAGGTLAYLMTYTTPVVNEFVVGTIGDLDLFETGDDEFKIIPGENITKDPTVTFNGNNVGAYVFVKVAAPGWTRGTNEKYSPTSLPSMTWTIASDWTFLTVENEKDHVYVYYAEVDAEEEFEASIIAGDTITVPNTITEGDLKNYSGTNLTFTAYAIQQDGFADAAAAWAQAKNAG